MKDNMREMYVTLRVRMFGEPDEIAEVSLAEVATEVEDALEAHWPFGDDRFDVVQVKEIEPGTLPEREIAVFG